MPLLQQHKNDRELLNKSDLIYFKNKPFMLHLKKIIPQQVDLALKGIMIVVSLNNSSQVEWHFLEIIQ